jgi:hypothetical protein
VVSVHVPLGGGVVVWLAGHAHLSCLNLRQWVTIGVDIHSFTACASHDNLLQIQQHLCNCVLLNLTEDVESYCETSPSLTYHGDASAMYAGICIQLCAWYVWPTKWPTWPSGPGQVSTAVTVN